MNLQPLNLQPLSDRVMVRMDDPETKKGGIFIPEFSQVTTTLGTVISIGPDVKDVTKGETVYVGEHSGTRFIQDGVSYIILREEQIACVIS